MNSPRTIILHTPENVCPFCNTETMRGGQYPSTMEGPGEYWYRCDTCGVGDDSSAFVESWVSDDEYPDTTTACVWVIEEQMIPELHDSYRSEAVEALREQEDDDERE